MEKIYVLHKVKEIETAKHVGTAIVQPTLQLFNIEGFSLYVLSIQHSRERPKGFDSTTAKGF